MNRNRFLNYFINTAFTCSSYFVYFFYPVFLMEQGLSGNQIGLLLMLFTITALMSSFLIGLFEDRFGARGNTVCGLLLMCVFYYGLITCRSFILFVPLFFVGGLGINLVRVTMNALFFKTHDSGRQGREIGLFKFLHQFFMGCGIIAGSLLIMKLDFHSVFVVSTVFSLILGGFALALRPSLLTVTPLSHYMRDLAHKRVLLFSAALLLFYLHWGAEAACYSPFLKQCLGLSTLGAGIFMGLPIIFLAFCTYYFGWRRDRGESTIRLAIIAIICSGAGLMLFAATHVVILSFLFRLIHEVGDAAFVIFTYVCIARLFPRERLGGTSGSMYVVMIGAQSCGAWIFSWMGASLGYSVPYFAAALCSLSAIPLILYTRSQYNFSPPDHD
jgi:MFS family permease